MANISIQNVKKMGRSIRRPNHTFNLKLTPFAIHPMMIAPVLPGETLQNLLYQCRAVTKPVTAPLIGWWYETYFFYCPFSCLPHADDLKDMVLDPVYDASALKAASTNLLEYTFKGGVSYVAECLEAIVRDYFRDEDETWNSPLLNTLPAAKTNGNSVFDSFTLASAMASYDETIVVGADDSVNASEIETAMQMWQFQRMNGLVQMDFEDWCSTYGVKPQSIEQDSKAELIRFTREWQYPSNTVNPTDGSVKSAVSWSLKESADKARYFKQPGFIFGVSVVRPKVYFNAQQGSATGLLTNGFSWLPATMNTDQKVSLVKTVDDATSGILINQTQDYWLDVRDLLMYGEQYVNHALNTTDMNAVTLPSTTGGLKYCSSTDVDNLFSGTDKFVVADGIVSLGIKSAVHDLS